MNRSKMMNKLMLVAATMALASCVDHRPVRNGLDDTSVYLTKTDLTAPNPKLGAGSADDGWLFRTMMIKTSSPNALLDYAFPGLQNQAQYVKLRFKENALQIVDGRRFQEDDPTDPNDDLASTTERVMLEFQGQHVDIKLRESLDGERTNFLEENIEEPWQKRQKFKVDFEKSSLDPLTSMIWIYGEVLKDCARVASVNLVPDSFEWDGADQYMSFVLEVNYSLNLFTLLGTCHDLVSLTTDTHTVTHQYRFSFYRRGPSNFVPQEIAEKDPVNKKYGSFQALNTFFDKGTGLFSAKSFLARWNPDREEPAVWYFHEGFPEKYKPIFTQFKTDTNQLLADAGAKLRIDFKEWNDGGLERQLGDLRYSFLVWHQDHGESWTGGYGPMTWDPRTGEIFNANVHMYNGAFEIYRFLLQEYLADNGGLAKPEPDKEWEEIACATGQTVAPSDETNRLRSTLWQEMRRVMELPEPADDEAPFDQMIPKPVRERTDFVNDYQRLLSELRYAEPGWNTYVWNKGPNPLFNNLAERVSIDREFEDAMVDIMMNQNPFEGVALYTQQGIEKQIEFMEQFREWRRNHDQLEMDKQTFFGMNNIYRMDPGSSLAAMATVARKCQDDGFWESNDEYTERILYNLVYGLMVHEFGHNLSLRHNFYGSADAKHTPENWVTNSVMDYLGRFEWPQYPTTWAPYDVAALSWIYGSDTKRAEVMAQDHLYCTDEHRGRSPMCQAYDTGFTPAEVVLNDIERYDWMYQFTNRRSYRTFWDTRYYIWNAYLSTFPMQRMWYLALFDWSGGGVQATLKRLDQLDESRTVLSDQEYNEIATDYWNNISAANYMTLAFYDAVINQPASFRNYQTEFDPYYGDVLRIGIILDKLFTTFAFMDMQEVYNYNPNIYTYVSMYDSVLGGPNYALSQRVLDNMLGANYDTFPWFKYYALGLFASATNTNLIGNVGLKDRIAIRRYENEMELYAEFSSDAIAEATDLGNPAQIFIYQGEEYVYTYLPDRAWHLIANKSRSPVSYQYMKDYNESLAQADETLDNFGLKILLAYHEYFNNFVGF